MWGVLIFWKDLVSQVFFVCGNIGKKVHLTVSCHVLRQVKLKIHLQNLYKTCINCLSYGIRKTI